MFKLIANHIVVVKSGLKFDFRVIYIIFNQGGFGDFIYDGKSI